MGSVQKEDNDVMIDIEAIRNEVLYPMTEDCCIYRVPYHLRKLNEDAYTPRIVSVGPFHYGNPRLKNMETYKKMYFQRFVKRAKTSLDNLVCCVEGLELRVRRSYSESIELSKRELVKVILVDACFILELLSTVCYREFTADDAILLKPYYMSYITLDLLLLENQLPFFVLEMLFNLAFSSHRNGSVPSLLDFTFCYFSSFNELDLTPTGNVTIKHFTDMLRTFHLQPSNKRSQRQTEVVSLLHNATELRKAGVKFKVNDISKCLLDLQFSGHHLQIPKFRMGDATETVFRNMVALEQCHYPDECYIIDYIAFLDFLIDTGEDVDILIQNGILDNWMGDCNEVAELINGLGKHVLHMNLNSDYLDICKRLNEFYENPWNKKKATLRRDYCKTHWQTAASIAGILLLILTIVQTVCSILQVL